MDVFFVGWFVFGLVGVTLLAFKAPRAVRWAALTMYAVLWLAMGAYFGVIK